MASVHDATLFVYVFRLFLYPSGTLGCPRPWQLPLHFPASDSAHPPRVVSATAVRCKTIGALDGSDLSFGEISQVPRGQRASPACHGLNPTQDSPFFQPGVR